MQQWVGAGGGPWSGDQAVAPGPGLGSEYWGGVEEAGESGPLEKQQVKPLCGLFLHNHRGQGLIWAIWKLKIKIKV